jgi:AcrR family transcriptional regulator
VGRPSRIDSKREELLPIIARAFGDLGYHRATTAELARRCRVRENILYRLWKDKKAMYIASIRHVYALAEKVWTEKAARPGGEFSIESVLEHEAEHLGEFGNHRLLFAGLSETEDRDIRRAVAEVYRDFHDFIRRRLAERYGKKGRRAPLDPAAAAWAIIGLGTACTIGRELKLLPPEERKRILLGGGKLVIGE